MKQNYQKINEETIRVETIREIKWPCDSTICNNKFLMSGNWEFLNAKEIKERCKCIQKETCIRVADLLSQWKLEDAFNLLKEETDE
jgi:hypothetical protein